MKSKHIFVLVFSILMSLSGFAQNSGKTFEKVKLKKANVVQDSMLSTFPLLVSIDEVETNLSGTGKAKKSFKDNSVSLYPVPEKGVIYIKLDKLPKDYKPILEFYNSGGSVIKNIYVKSKISTINLAKIPAGTYTISIDLNEERYSWEIEKE